jgi:HlyD family secretion protein
MAKKRNGKAFVTPRRLAGVGCLAGLVLAVVFTVVLYQQVRSLFSRGSQGQGQGWQDAAVQRGSIYDGVHAYGVAQPASRVTLSFRVARGKVVAVPVETGQEVKAGQTLVELDKSELEGEAAQAREDLLLAQRKLADLGTASADSERYRLELDVRDARTALDKAQRELAAFDDGQDTPQTRRTRGATDLEAARVALAELRESTSRRQEIEALLVSYNQAEVKHGEYTLITNPSEQDRDTEWMYRNEMLARKETLDTARLRYDMDVRAAERNVAEAESTLRDLDRAIAVGSQAAGRSKLAAAVKTAGANLQAAQERLSAAKAGSQDVERARAEADVVKLEGLLADAEAALKEAKLVAPFGGLVDELQIEPDTLVTGSGPMVTVVDVSSMHLVAQISDIDVARVSKGLPVQITFDAFRGQAPLAGRLGDIPGYGDYEGGITSFQVPIELVDGSLPPNLRPGMSGNIFIPTEQRENVLLVPATAVQYNGVEYYVLRVRGGKVENREVRIGASDGINSEVLEGLSEGDVVRVPLMGPMNSGVYFKGG